MCMHGKTMHLSPHARAQANWSCIGNHDWNLSTKSGLPVAAALGPSRSEIVRQAHRDGLGVVTAEGGIDLRIDCHGCVTGDTQTLTSQKGLALIDLAD
jgi:hypothetical protein